MTKGKSNTSVLKENSLFHNVRTLIETARKTVVRSVNSTMVHTYFKIGELIVEHEQKGKRRADYAQEILKNLSVKLIREFGRGFSVDNLENMRKFYMVYGKSETVSRISEKEFYISWSHYVFLIKLEKKEREFYENMAIKERWSLREMERQFNSALYERLVLSKNKKAVKKISEKGLIVSKPDEVIKNPYILEFLGLEESHKYSETELEQAIIDNLQHFILELGRGFLFVGRQERITFD